MFRNYIKTALRNLTRNKGFSAINIAGLAIGIAVFILIGLYVRHELTVDRFHKNLEHIYRLQSEEWVTTPAPTADLLRGQFPEVREIVRFNLNMHPTIVHGEQRYRLSNMVLADTEVFKIFSFNLIQGNPETVLTEPMSLILSQSMAKTVFGDVEPLGNTILYNNQHPFIVTGIMEDLPSNSSFIINAIGSFESLKAITGNPDVLGNFQNWNYYTYLLLQPGTHIQELTGKINTAARNMTGQSQMGEPPTLMLTPFKGAYFDHTFSGDTLRKGNLQFVIIYAIIAVFIVLIACVNFINLTTAHASRRAKEIGVRKVVGSSRNSLIIQFLCESTILSFFGLLLAMGLVELLLPVFNNLIVFELDSAVLFTPSGIALLIGGTILIGILSGMYPAFYLTGFKPVDVLKGKSIRGTGGVHFRRALIIFQFTIAITLIIGTIVIYHQLNYVRTTDYGFSREQILTIWMNQELSHNRDAFRNEVTAHPNVLGFTVSNTQPGYVAMRWRRVLNGEVKQFYTLLADPDYIDVMGLQLIEGRNFSWDIESDREHGYIFNETAVRLLGLDDPLETRFGESGTEGTLIGIVKDFHFATLHTTIEPLALYWLPAWSNLAHIKIASADIPGTIDHIRSVYNNLSPSFTFSYSFVDEAFNRLYRTEERLAQIFFYFSGLAIFIACLGLIGLATFTAEQRTKEIGVRKVLGAGHYSIIFLLSKEFTRWVIVANLIAWPIAYYSMNRWLEGFAYRAEIGISIFLFAAIIAFVIAIVSVSFQAIRASLSNPVDALRYE